MLCASPRSANLPIAKADEFGYPFTLADAPVSKIAPDPRAAISRAACCATRNPPNALTAIARATPSGSRSVTGPLARALAL